MKDHAITQEIHSADQAINRNDFDTVAKSYTQNATLVVRPGHLVSGRSDIREAHKKISEYFNGSLAVSQGEIVIIEAGNTALVLAQTFIKSPGKLDSEYSAERDAIYVYVKDSNDKWLCAIDNSYGFDVLRKTA